MAIDNFKYIVSPADDFLLLVLLLRFESFSPQNYVSFDRLCHYGKMTQIHHRSSKNCYYVSDLTGGFMVIPNLNSLS